MEQRTTYTLQKTGVPAILPSVGTLSAAEVEVVLLMRRVIGQSPRPLIVIEQLGDAVRLHQTMPSKWVKT